MSLIVMGKAMPANIANGELQDFSSWFRQSTVAHQDGRPKAVYHGTRADFDVFQCHKKRNSNFGIHFGSILQAEFFSTYDARQRVPGRTLSGGRIIPAFLRIRNPLRMPDIFERKLAGVEIVAGWLFKNAVIDLAVAKKACRARSVREAHACLAIAVEAAGYDGIVYENEHEGGTDTINEDSYVVFRACQIRSAFCF